MIHKCYFLGVGLLNNIMTHKCYFLGVGLLNNIMIHKCYFLGVVALNRGFNAKILYRKQTKRLQERLSHVLCELYFGVVCGLIGKAREKFIIIIRSLAHFTKQI